MALVRSVAAGRDAVDDRVLDQGPGGAGAHLTLVRRDLARPSRALSSTSAPGGDKGPAAPMARSLVGEPAAASASDDPVRARPRSDVRHHDRVDAERERLAEADRGEAVARLGSVRPERAWGTVREDYSADGDAWSFFPHDHARSRVYRWNEDGMAGFCDETQNWCLSLGLWNGVDPILKERMFGLAGPQGNHGEDVKEYWWYLDGTPTHSWNTWRYHYPQRRVPLRRPGRRERPAGQAGPGVRAGRHRHLRRRTGTGWSLSTTPRPAPRDLLMRITVENAGPDEATLHVLPTLWFRNTWSWGYDDHPKPTLRLDGNRIVGSHSRSGPLVLVGDGDAGAAVLRERDQHRAAVRRGRTSRRTRRTASTTTWCTAPTRSTRCTAGTKAALHYRVTVPAGGSTTIKVRMVGVPHPALDVDPLAPSVEPIDLGAEFDAVVADRQGRGGRLLRAGDPGDHDAGRGRTVARQAFAGLLWGKQFFHYDVTALAGRRSRPTAAAARAAGAIRNGDWRHLNNHEVILMPDPWEYPWFAAWDLAFHCVTLAHIDPAFAKAQLVLLLREWYMHPNGQIPAYEWNFSDVNPPVHAWAALQVFELDGGTDFTFLARIFHKLLINFTWWVDNKDHGGNNLFEGGFMGLDNIAPLDRSTLPPSDGLPRAGRLHRLDGDVRPGPAGDGAAAGHARPVVRGRGHEVLRALPGHRRRREQRRPVGRAGLRTSTTCCTWPTAPTSRSR